jgi:hypothetical protein
MTTRQRQEWIKTEKASKGHSFCKQCLHDLQFMKKRSSSPKLSKLTRADISCQFKKTRSLCRLCLRNEWTLVSKPMAIILSDDCLMTVWWLSDDCLMTVWWLPDDFLMTADDCLMTIWWLSDDCLVTVWWLPDDCLMTARWLPDDCLMITWRPPDDHLMTAWR